VAGGISPRCAENAAQGPGRFRRCPDNGIEGGPVLGKQPTNDEWRVYYERADEVRAVVGDPFKRHIVREALRERILLVGSTVFVMGLVTVFLYLLTAS
jgi:hypothetical protein